MDGPKKTRNFAHNQGTTNNAVPLDAKFSKIKKIVIFKLGVVHKGIVHKLRYKFFFCLNKE